MSPEPRPDEDTPTGRRPGRTPRQRPAPRRFPAWLAIPVATLGGFMAASWLGGLFGAIAGYFLWRSRR
ncbi:MAG: hypothetical protein KY453_11045 [Gemmatimonadetes bacterium]|nr:hypothetical protein [Gemmatimonadota bacterium]